MKKFSILFALAALLTAGCSETPLPTGADDGKAVGKAVKVDFRLEAIETDVSLEPMTRVTNYTNRLSYGFRVLVLKKIDSRWIVDGLHTVLRDPEKGQWESQLITGAFPPFSFGLELRPGDYRAVAVINPIGLVWNQLKQGDVVADEANPALPVPPLATYSIQTYGYNKGYRALYNEVFVAVAEFKVNKSGDLHSQNGNAVPLRAERRVGKLRVLLNNQPSPKHTFLPTQHFFEAVFRSTKPFPEGIDALGGMYYSPERLYELPWYMSLEGAFHPSEKGPGNYQICQTNSTVFSPFIFAAPGEEQPVEISDIYIAGQSPGFDYYTNAVYTRSLAASKITGIVFRATDSSYEKDWQTVVELVESTDEAGVPENAVELFPSFFEWNAESYKYPQQ